MAHPAIENLTPFAFAPLFVADEEGRPLIVTIVKGTFDVSARGKVTVAEKQAPVDFAGTHHGEPGQSSLRFESDTAIVKPATDCVLIGHAISTRPTREMLVGFGVGPVQRFLRVTGDRWWVQTSFGFTMTVPEAFERIPLVYERAFGGWDRTSELEAEHECEPRNPVGVGFVGRHGTPVHGTPLPNIEDPADPLTTANGRCRPAGFGFLGPEWEPRCRFGGTYDEAWSGTRAPLLPKDFDRRFFSAASEGLVAPGYLQGDETVFATGVTPEGRWEFALPGVPAPMCAIEVREADPMTLDTKLDTVAVDADTQRVILTWRAYAPLRTGPHDVARIEIGNTSLGRRPRAVPSAAFTSTT